VKLTYVFPRIPQMAYIWVGLVLFTDAKTCAKAAVGLLFAAGAALVANVLCIEAARDRGVSCAFDDGAAIWKQSHFKWLLPKLQHEVIVPDAAERL
jgi:hypothetical protein